MFNNKNMSNVFEKIRNKLGISREEMADCLKTTVGAVSNYEYGTRLPKLLIGYRLIDLANSHGITISLEDIYPRPSKTAANYTG